MCLIFGKPKALKYLLFDESKITLADITDESRIALVDTTGESRITLVDITDESRIPLVDITSKCTQRLQRYSWSLRNNQRIGGNQAKSNTEVTNSYPPLPHAPHPTPPPPTKKKEKKENHFSYTLCIYNSFSSPLPFLSLSLLVTSPSFFLSFLSLKSFTIVIWNWS